MASKTKKQYHKATTKPTRRITEGAQSKSELVDIVLSAPELFYFDIQKYIQAINSAKSTSFSFRSRLYDMYESALMDLHLAGVLAKRLKGVTKIPIEFHRDGVPDDEINRQLASPWMKKLREEIVLAQFWGFTLLQFYTDEEGDIRFYSVPRKHYDPIRQRLLRHQTDTEGTPISEFPNMLFVGSERELGILSQILVAVLYKRNNYADWAKYCELYAIPIQEYTYNAGDEETRRQLLLDARNRGNNAVYIHPAESNFKFVESNAKSGTSELFKDFTEYWDQQIAVRVLGNTLTTSASDTGTQALGTVHKAVEEELNEDDCNTVLDVLNYYMIPIFEALGYNVSGGKFVSAKRKEIDITTQADIYLKMQQLGLPLDADDVYEALNVKKPDDFDKQIAEQEEQRKALAASLEGASKEDQTPSEEHSKEDKKKGDKSLKDRLAHFFGLAPGETPLGEDTDF
nr:MAG TPA: portal [Caudoviricetes sp.]